SNRSGCMVTPMLPFAVTTITCQNATMAQFAEQLSLVPQVGRIVDATGIQGFWDITLTFGGGSVPGRGDGLPVPPVTLPDALGRQLGLRLAGAKRRMPFFVVDHSEEVPTEN